MHNLLIYGVIAGFLLLLGRSLKRRNQAGFNHYRAYLLMLIPAFVLPIIGAYLGSRFLPRHELVIHGYKVPLPEGSRKLYIGSDARDQLVIHHRIRDRENIEPGLVELDFLGNKQCRITQTQVDTPNVVSIDRMPIRSLELEPGKTHRISFAAFGYSDADDKVLLLEIPPVRSLFGDVAFSEPVFSFRGERFSAGFSRATRILPNVAMDSGDMRHLAHRKRIFHKGLDSVNGSLLRQAALLRKGKQYFLIANDAQIRLDGRDFPNSVTLTRNVDLRIESLQLGGNRFVTELKLIQPLADQGHVVFNLKPAFQRRIKLPAPSVADRICLAAHPSAYSQAYDILDDQFPQRGLILSREDQRFIFRGEQLVPGQIYSCGKVVFGLESVHFRDLLVPALYGIVFMLSAFFVPRSMIRRVPLLGPVVAIALFLSSMRQLFAFRAWLGPPYNLNVFLDSAAAPYLCVLSLVVLLSFAPFYEHVTNGLIYVRNLCLPHRTLPLRAPRDRDGALASLGLLIYGLVLYALVRKHLDGGFLLSMLFFALISIGLGPFSRLERYLNAHPVILRGEMRFKPLVGLVVLFALALVAAPLLGGHEIIPFLPGRIRPDIFIQLILLVMAAYLAGVWEQEKRNRIAHLMTVLGIYAGIVVLPFLQGLLAKDMGFFLVVVCPLLTLLLMASWSLDRRIPLLFWVSAVMLVLVPILFKLYQFPLDSVSAQRLAFWLDKPRLRSEHFFDYQAQIPILWSSAQGWFGGGYFAGDWYPALRGTAVNDNVAAVFVQGELGGIGTILVMGIYAGVCLAGMLYIRDYRERVGGFRIWLVTGIALTFIWTATAMFLQNLGYMPLTGKNLPLLGLDSLNDTIRYGLLMGLMARYMREPEV